MFCTGLWKAEKLDNSTLVSFMFVFVMSGFDHFYVIIYLEQMPDLH